MALRGFVGARVGRGPPLEELAAPSTGRRLQKGVDGTLAGDDDQGGFLLASAILKEIVVRIAYRR
ncbi:hypothetical protein C4901_02800 [Acidiferrobacter sp. SPIII_3]|jgi:hypothetical protein|nr:hypothetical protein C4901_02800 [Acidiferrobacter sp. SPIII_3]